MDVRTKRKILSKIFNGEVAETRVRGYWYEIEYNQEIDCVIAEPRNQKGSIIRSDVRESDYEYTHAGEIAAEVFKVVWELDEALRLKWTGKERLEKNEN